MPYVSPYTEGTTEYINDYMQHTAHQVVDAIRVKGMLKNMWTSYIPKGTFPEELGEEIKKTVYDRAQIIGTPQSFTPMYTTSASMYNNGALGHPADGTYPGVDPVTAAAGDSTLPQTPPGYTPLAVRDAVDNDGTAAGNQIPYLPPIDRVAFTQHQYAYSLQWLALEGPRINLNDLRYAYKRKEQLSAMLKVFGDLIDRYWINRNRRGYGKICQVKITLDDDYVSDFSVNRYNLPVETGFRAPTAFANGAKFLHMSVLDYVRQYLIQEQAPGVSDEGRVGIYQLCTSFNTARALKNADSVIREDLRYAKADELFMRWNINHTYNDWAIFTDSCPDRWTWDGVNSKWVEVPQYIRNPITGRMVTNPAYLNAFNRDLWEDTYILFKEVTTSLTPVPNVHIGDLSYDSQNYYGETKWINVQHELTNPDKTVGFHRAILANSFKPEAPEFGVVIRHLVPDAGVGYDPLVVPGYPIA